ncbi:MAG: ATP-binding protein [Parvibaculales bacterium]
MKKDSHEYSFEFLPTLIRFLGEELIHDKKIAIAELIKNSYDADASMVTLTIEQDAIILEDNGTGMNVETIKNHWLKVGNSSKANQGQRTPKYKRLPIGEKGIGRLGVHKLGKKIKVISKSENNNEVEFDVNWDDFDQKDSSKNLKPIEVVEQSPAKLFTDGNTGTILIINKLKETISKKEILGIESDLLKLLPPFPNNISSNFVIHLKTREGLFTEIKTLSADEIIKDALFYYRIVLQADKITDFEYEFKSPNENKIASRKLDFNDTNIELSLLKEKHCSNNPSEFSPKYLGKVIFQGYIFDAKFSKLFNQSHDKKIVDYLKENGGIRVYRDGMRVYNYGEGGKDNDILNLDRKRAKRLGDNIGYNQLLASIELDRETSKNLKEKTNREGFIHNEYFLSLQHELDFCMDAVLYYRKHDRANMEPLFGKEYDKADIGTKIKAIVRQINKLDITDNEKQNLSNELLTFSDEFAQLKNILLTASNTGLNLTIIVHEIDKILSHLGEKIIEKDIAQIESVFIHLTNSINSYKEIIRLDKKTSSLPVSSLIDQALFNADYRFNSHNIELYNTLDFDLSIIGKKGLILGIFTNVFDNAIYWLDYYKIETKKIFIRAYEAQESVFIVIADNGKGFNISFEAALRPFISGRFDDSSMGIGLHLAEQIMIAHEGSLGHGNWQEDGLPEEFANGAILKLKFIKG